MSLLKSDDFIADVERQFEWYAANAGWEVVGKSQIAMPMVWRPRRACLDNILY